MISADQALASKVLRLVNSSYYGFPRKIATITNAVVILGFNTVRNLTTSLGVFNAFDARGQKTALDRDAFWAHSMGIAAAAGVIARRKGIGAKSVEEVFIGGLLHDIGKLFLDQYFPDQYAIAMKLAARPRFRSGRRKRLPWASATPWSANGSPKSGTCRLSLTAMITLHHQPVFAKEYFELAATIQAADHVARKLALGNAGDTLVPPLAPEVEKWLAFSPPVWEAVETETCRKFDESKDFLNVL